MKKEVYIPPGIVLVAFILLLIGSPSIWITAVFGFFLVVSLLYYYLFYSKTAVPDLRIAQWYYVALAVQCAHFIEEYIGEIYVRLPALLEIPPIGKDEFVLFNLGAYAIFILGGIALFKGSRSFMLIPLFFVLFGVLANGIIHLILTLWNGSYFPGFYTGLVYLFLGPYLLKLLGAEAQDTPQGSRG